MHEQEDIQTKMGWIQLIFDAWKYIYNPFSKIQIFSSESSQISNRTMGCSYMAPANRMWNYHQPHTSSSSWAVANVSHICQTASSMLVKHWSGACVKQWKWCNTNYSLADNHITADARTVDFRYIIMLVGSEDQATCANLRPHLHVSQQETMRLN